MKLKIKKLHIFLGFISLSIMIMSITGLFIDFSKFSTKGHIAPLIKLPTSLPIAGNWIAVSWTFPFYFTIQSNFLVIFYLFLVGLGIIDPNKNKNVLIFELITLLNIMLTGIIFWSALSWNMLFIDNVYLLIENIGLHAIVPVFMMSIWIQRTFINKKQTVFMKYIEFWKFLIFPFIWLVISIIVYYSSRTTVYYLKTYVFANDKLAQSWQKILSAHHIRNNVRGNIVQSAISGVWGNAVYFFLNFDYVPAWITIIIIFIIAIVFILISLLLISINKQDSKIYKTFISKRRK